MSDNQKTPTDETPSIEQDTMAEESAAHQQTEETLSIKENSKPESRGFGITLWLAFIALSVLGIGGWMAYQQWLQEQTLQDSLTKQVDQLAQQNATIESLNQQLASSQNQMRELNSGTQELQDNQSLLRQQLTVTQDKLRLLGSHGKQEWQLEEAHYYLTLAQQKLLFEKQVDTSLALLAQADQTLLNAGDLNHATIRQAISDDRSALLALPRIDSQGLLHRLSSLSKTIEQLQPVAFQLSDSSTEPQLDNKAWFDRLIKTLERFGDDAFKFRTHDEKIQPLLTEQQKSVLQATLQLAITQAQSALLKGDQSYYQSRLNFVKEMLSTYFQLNDQGSVVINELNELEQQSVVEKLDYSLTSLPLLKELREQRRLQWYSSQQAPSPIQEDEQ